MKIINQEKKCTLRIKDLAYMKSYRRILFRVILYLTLFLISVTFVVLPNIIRNLNNNEKSKEITRVRFATDLKYILFWKHNQKLKQRLISQATYSRGQKEFIYQNCPHFNCYITYNKTFLGDERNFDAVVFDIMDIRKLHVNYIDLERSPHQIYVFKSFESAENHPVCDPVFDDFFNWTWTYKTNSEIPHYFLNIFTNKGQRIGPSNEVAWKDMAHSNDPFKTVSNKTKAVAWLITNCKLKSKYKIFIKELNRELKGYNYTLDILGPCSTKRCKKGRLSECYNVIEYEYFFNLVTEDAISEDYVTEKMMRAMHYLTVPLVYGGANYSKFLPPGSYINVRDFDLKKLGAIIDYLIRNPSKYSYFFDWKQYYYYTSNPRNRICDVCTKLNEMGTEKQSYKNLRSWWTPNFDEVCQRAKIYDLFNKPFTRHVSAEP